MMVLGKIHSSSVGGGEGATSSENPCNSRESPYLRKRFYTCPFFLPKDSEKSKIENFSPPPLRDALKIFRPPPLRPKILNCPKTHKIQYATKEWNQDM